MNEKDEKTGERLVTTGAAARAFGIHRQTLAYWIERAQIKPAKVRHDNGPTALPTYLWSISDLKKVAAMRNHAVENRYKNSPSNLAKWHAARRQRLEQEAAEAVVLLSE